MEKRKLERQAAVLRASGAFDRADAVDARRRLERRTHGSKQIDFPPLQKEVAWVAPFMIGLSLVCTVIVIIILLTDFDGAFIGPWG